MNSPGVMMRYNPQMDGMYELVFRGEVLDGQHRAVVKRRLRELLNLSESQADNLFADKRVVIKSSADESTAKKTKALFKKAGGRLRVLPTKVESVEKLESVKSVKSLESVKSVKSVKSAEGAEGAESAETIESGVEQAPSAETDAAAGLSLQNRDSTAPASEPSAEPEAPNYALADLGAVMADLRQEVPAEVRDVDFEVAEVGADMIAEPVAEVPVSVTDVTFDLAEVGADIGDQEEQVVHDTPDISHLGLVEE